MSLKQLINCLFDRKKAKFGFKIDFVKGYVNNNEISKIQKGECLLNFEDEKFILVQGDKTISDAMSDVFNMRTWTFKGDQYFAIRMKTHSEYMFNLKDASFWFKSIENYAKAFNIVVENCGESEE